MVTTLSLPYTPPLQRDLRPAWKRVPFVQHVDCHEMDDDDYSICIYKAHFHSDYRRPLLPLINISTAQPIEWEGADPEDWTTSIWFKPTRESFRSAYRLARILKNCNGEAYVMQRAVRHLISIEVAANHNITVLEEMFVLVDRKAA